MEIGDIVSVKNVLERLGFVDQWLISPTSGELEYYNILNNREENMRVYLMKEKQDEIYINGSLVNKELTKENTENFIKELIRNKKIEEILN